MNYKSSYFILTCLGFGFAFLYIPILSMVVFSFNASKLVTVWDAANSPTLKWYYSLLNNEEGFLCQQSTSCPETSTLNPPLWEQARAISSRDKSPLVSQWGYFEPFTFWRFRELTATYTLPDRLAAKVARAQGASITLGARNLHVWTKWTGADPEQNYSQGDTQLTLLTAGPARYMTVRLNVHY